VRKETLEHEEPKEEKVRRERKAIQVKEERLVALEGEVAEDLRARKDVKVVKERLDVKVLKERLVPEALKELKARRARKE